MANMLRKQFDYVREAFFPRWDRHRQWRVNSADDLNGASGLCDIQRKRIRVLRKLHGEELTLVLIHEVAHVFGHGHGRPWMTRMEQAAARAVQIGRKSLATAIRTEVDGHRSSPKVRACHVYSTIDDTVCELMSVDEVPSCSSIIDSVARYYGILPRDFFKQYPRARSVFDRAVKRRQADLELAQKYLERFRKAK